MEIGTIVTAADTAPMHSVSFYNATELTLAQLHSVERLVFGDHTFLNAASVKLFSGVSCEA